MFFLLCGLAPLACGPSQRAVPTREPMKQKPVLEANGPRRSGDAMQATAPTCTEAELTDRAEARAAFEKAETFYLEEFTPYVIGTAPANSEEAKRALRELMELADQARDNFLGVVNRGRTTRAVPAMIRLGDVLHLQARKLLDIPIPQDIHRLDAEFPDKRILVQYRQALGSVALPLLEQARTSWTKAVETSKTLCIENEWTALARKRLATTRIIDSVRATLAKNTKLDRTARVLVPEPAEAPSSCRGTTLDLEAVLKDSSCNVAGSALPLPPEVGIALSPVPLVSRKGKGLGELVLTNSAADNVELRLSGSCGMGSMLSAKIYNASGKHANKAPSRSSCNTALVAVLCGDYSTKRFVIEPKGTARFPVAFSTRTKVLHKDCNEREGRRLPKGQYKAAIRFSFLDGLVSGPLKIH